MLNLENAYAFRPSQNTPQKSTIRHSGEQDICNQQTPVVDLTSDHMDDQHQGVRHESEGMRQEPENRAPVSYSPHINEKLHIQDMKAFSAQKYRLEMAMKQVLELYNKKPQFSGSVEEDWVRHLR